jgi:hypothetical protein
MFRLSLTQLLLLTVFVSVALGGLLYSNQVTASVVAFVAAVIGLYHLANALFATGARRAFGIGFVVSSLSYWLLLQVLSPYVEQNRGRHSDFGTTQLLIQLHDRVAVSENLNNQTRQWQRVPYPPIAAGGTNQIRTRPDRFAFIETGQSLFFLLFGFLGARFSQVAWQSRSNKAEV